MKVIRPNAVTSATLISSNATEEHAAYNAATVYASGAKAVYANSVYESLQAANTGKTPDANPSWWVRRGPGNAWAMFDDQINTSTKNPISLISKFFTGIADSIGVVSIDGESVRLTVRDGDGGPVIYDAIQSLSDDPILDWYEYFFNDPDVRKKTLIFSSIPPFSTAVATLEVVSGGVAAVGAIVFGSMLDIGCTSFGAKAGITDYSRTETDDFGVTVFVQRPFSKKLSCSVLVERGNINRVQNAIYNLRSTRTLWIATDAPELNEPMVIYGFYEDFYCAIDYPLASIYQFEIKGLI
jgi:hypothetical protein